MSKVSMAFEGKVSILGKILNNISKTLTLALIFVGFDLLADVMQGLGPFENKW
jgi:hypothetical protein